MLSDHSFIMSDCQVSTAATYTNQAAVASRKDATPNTLPPKIPRFEKSASSTSCSISDDSLTKHLTALWEREDAVVPVTSTAAAVSRVGSKRKAASVSSYLADSQPDVPTSVSSHQPSTSNILSKLLSSFSGITSSPVNVSVISSVASDSPHLSLQKNILLLQKDRLNVAAAAKQPSAATGHGSLPLRWSATESVSGTNNIFRLPTYEQVIGNRATLSSPSVKGDAASNDVFLPSPQTISSSFVGSVVSSLLTDAVTSSAGANSSLLLNQATNDSATIASHMQLDDSELLRQLEQILSEPGLSVSDIDNVLGGCLVVPPSLPQSLSAVDQKAISDIQSQLMSVETSPSSSSAVASNVSTQSRNGTLCQLLRGKSPLTSDALLPTDKSEIRSHGNVVPVNHQPLFSTAAVRSTHTGSGQYLFFLKTM